MDAVTAASWQEAWEREILGAATRRYCDSETGEELGWLVTPVLAGFRLGHLATGDSRWVDLFMDWAKAVVDRAVVEPDGYTGWPKEAGASTPAVAPFVTDNLLGEAMALRQLALMARTILSVPALAARHGRAAQAHLELNEATFAKWEARGAWRETPGGGVWVVPPFGLDGHGGWTAGYDERVTGGFTLPANKQNHIALWLLDLAEVTGKAVYRQRAAAWWQVMRGRLRPAGAGYVWNYWDPAGPWDHRGDGRPRHWVGVHPNGGYYGIDAEGMVAAHAHGLVFGPAELQALIATNRDRMWNGRIAGAGFCRIDGGLPDPRWARTPGSLWTALVPHDATLRQVFEANFRPASWGGLATTPWYLAWWRSGGASA